MLNGTMTWQQEGKEGMIIYEVDPRHAETFAKEKWKFMMRTVTFN